MQPFGFAGGLWDRANGLIRFGARDYVPSTGNWRTRDEPFAVRSVSNRYRYIDNEPVNHTDETGRTGTPLSVSENFRELPKSSEQCPADDLPDDCERSCGDFVFTGEYDNGESCLDQESWSKCVSGLYLCVSMCRARKKSPEKGDDQNNDDQEEQNNDDQEDYGPPPRNSPFEIQASR